MLPFLNLGPLAIPTKPLLYLFGIWLLPSIAEWGARRRGLSPGRAENGVLWALLVGFAAARLAFAVANWEASLARPVSIVWPLTSGYTAWVGVIAGALFWIVWHRQDGLWRAADAVTPALCVGAAIVALADGLGGPGYGAAARLGPLATHPVQLYEAFLALAVGGVWWRTLGRPSGTGCLLTVAVYAFGLLLITPLRGNTPITADGWYAVQWLSLLVSAGALLLLAWRAPPSATPAG